MKRSATYLRSFTLTVSLKFISKLQGVFGLKKVVLVIICKLENNERL